MENKEVKEKKSKKGLIIGLVIGGAVLLILAVLFLLLFILKPTYKVTVNTGGRELIKNVVVEDNVLKELPEVKLKENEYIVAWVNDKGEAVRPGIPLDDDTGLTPVPGNPIDELVTLKFETGTDEVISDIVIKKGSEVILPVKPKDYKDWKFLYWVDKNNVVILSDRIINEDTTIYAYWVKPEKGKEKVTIKFETGTKEKVEPIKLYKGSKYLFPSLKEKNGDKVFKGWLDPDGKLLTVEDTVEKDITLTAKWVEPYTCPENCTPNEDGKTCVRKTTVAPSKQTLCPATEWTNSYGQTYCIDLSTKECDRQCASGEPFGTYEVDYTYEDGYDQYGPIIKLCCVKKVNYVEENVCPAGYERDGDNCTLTETIECTAN